MICVHKEITLRSFEMLHMIGLFVQLTKTVSHNERRFEPLDIHVKRVWDWSDWFVVSIRLIGFTLSVSSILWNTPEDKLGMVTAFAIVAYAAPQFLYLPGRIRPRSFITLEIVLSASFALYTFALGTENAVGYFYIPMFVIGCLSTMRTLYWVVPAGLLAFPLLLMGIGDREMDFYLSIVANLALFTAFGFGFGVFVRQKQEQANMLRLIEQKNAELERTIRQVERVTLLEERSRMSRELHDTVGHSLTASIVAMEAVRKLMQRDPQSAEQRLNELIRFSRENLDRFRRTVHEMAMNELKLPIGELLRQTAEGFGAQTGTKMIIEIDPIPADPPEAVKLALLRCLQEALTNAKKHGGSTEIQIRLRMTGHTYCFDVRDNGSGFESMESGFGISGMKERIESLRGSFRIESAIGEGTAITCIIPMGVNEWNLSNC